MHLLPGLFASAFLVTPHPRVLQGTRLLTHTSTTPLPPRAQPPAVPKPPTLQEDEQKTDDTPDYIAHHAPKSTYLILNAPAIASFVLVKGWNKEALDSFTHAVNMVVEKNPVLTGRAVCPKNWWKNPEIGIVTGTFLPGEHSFVETIDKSDSLPPLEGLDTAELLDYTDKLVSPLVDKLDSTLQQIHKKSPLFEVKVIQLPDNTACIYTKMSHCIGDLVTYYEIIDQISSLGKGEDIKPIHWDNPLKVTHEIFPEQLSKRDFELLYGFSFIAGIASHVPTMFLRKQEYLLLDSEKLKAVKAKLKEKGMVGASSNDVITAALCDANRSTDVFCLTKSMRGTAGLHPRDGGNLHVEIPIERTAARYPEVVKNTLEQGHYYESDEVPVAFGRIGRLSNCVAPVNQFVFGGLKPYLYCPSKSFLDHCPLDTAIIFRVSKGQDAVLHNFEKMNRDSKLLNDILMTSDE